MAFLCPSSGVGFPARCVAGVGCVVWPRSALCLWLALVFAGIGGGAAWGGDDAALRRFYPELSDSEFASIRPERRFYPSVWKVWAAGPPPNDAYFGLDRPKYAEDAMVKYQRVALSYTKDPIERSGIVIAVGGAANPLGNAVVREVLAVAEDVPVRLDCMRSLALLGERWSVGEAAGRMVSPYPLERAFAVRLMALESAGDVTMMRGWLAEERHPLVRREMLTQLAGVEVAAGDWPSLWDARVPEEIAIGLPALYAAKGAERAGEALTELCGHEAESVRCLVMAAMPAGFDRRTAVGLVARLLSDPSPAVRAAVAEVIGRVEDRAQLDGLLTLSKAPESLVRRAAATSLRQFPGKPAMAALLRLGGDSGGRLLRLAAVESMVAMAGDFPVEEAVAAALRSRNPDARTSACRVLAGIRSGRYIDVLRKLTASSKRPGDIAAAIDALAAGGGRAGEQEILARGAHDSPVVRSAVASAVGALKLKSGYKLLTRYCLEEREETVRRAAIRACGVSADVVFDGTLLTVLRRTDYRDAKNPEFLGADDRSWACWSAARLPALSDALSKRLWEQIRNKVVLTTDGPGPDSNRVRGCAVWALAVQARALQDAEIRRRADSALKWLTRPDSVVAEDGISRGLWAYAREARGFLEGKAVDPVPLRLGRVRFRHRPLTESELSRARK